MKKYRRFGAIIASAAVIASLAAVPMSASAAGTTYTPRSDRCYRRNKSGKQ